ncbi:MAG TPA: ComEC/Rec2 family competence protein [Candidatus Paceibacterota bacterium]
MKHRKYNIVYIAIFALIISTIIVHAYFALHDPKREVLRDYVGTTVNFEGTIATKPEKRDFNQVFVFETGNNVSMNILTGILIRVVTDRYGEYDYGDKVRITGKLLYPRNFADDDGRSFDYINYLGKDDVYYEFKKAEVKVIEKTGMPFLSGIIKIKNLSGILFSLKERFLDNLDKVLGEPYSALAGGLLVGEKASLGKELLDDFRRVGLIHIVVLSGYNITIIAVSIRRFLSFLPRTASIFLGVLGIILFGILVGGGATVIRSCIMALIALFAEFLRKDYGVFRALIISALLMLAHNPMILFYDPSFQLSFLAVLGLVCLSSAIEKKLEFVTEKFGMRSIISSTLATQVFVSPLIIYMMGQISIIGILANILILPFIPLTMLFVFFAGIFGFFSSYLFHFLSQLAGWISHILLSYELFIVKHFARLPFAYIEIPKFSIWIVVGCYVFYLALFLKLPSIVSQFIFEKKSSI